MWKKSAALAVTLATLAVANGCTKNNPPQAAQQASQPSSRPIHSVQVKQLKPLMQTLLRSTSTNWPKTLPTDVEQPVDPVAQQKAYEQATKLADELVIAAGQIPATVGGKSLPDEYRAGFLHEVEVLKDQAKELRKNATEKRAESMSRNLDAINVSCINCHSKYRDLTGNVDPLQARGNGGEESPLVMR
jgi:hypothetical protein